MKDPYDILGISQNATDEEVKEAYRKLARKYQSENYESGPLSGVAQKKMQEIDEAYDRIIVERRSSSSSSSADYTAEQGANTGYYSANTGNSYAQYSDIRQKIYSNRIDDAETLLDGVPVQKRDAEWYFLKGSVQYKRGWFDEARNNFSNACRMNPTNREYQAAYENVNNPRSAYRRPRRSSDSDCGACDICCSLLCADSCCECCGGDLIPCC